MSSTATTGRRPSTLLFGRRTGCGPTYATGWRPPLPGMPYVATGVEEWNGVDEWNGVEEWNGVDEWKGVDPMSLRTITMWSRPTPRMARMP